MNKLLKCFSAVVLSSLVALPLFSCGNVDTKVSELENENSELIKKQAELEAQIANQKLEYEQKISDMLSSHSEELATMNKQIESLNNKHNEEVNKLHENYELLNEKTSSQIATLEKKLQDEELSYKSQINELNKNINSLKENDEKLKAEYENQIKDLNNSHQTKVNELNKQIKDLEALNIKNKGEYETKLNELNKAHEEKVNTLNLKIDELIKSNNSLKIEYENQIQSLKDVYDVKISTLNSEVERLNNKLVSEEASFNEQKLAYENQINTLNKTHEDEVKVLNDKIATLNENEATLKKQYEDQINELNTTHKAKVDELNQKIDKLINDMNNSDTGALIEKYEKQIADLNLAHQNEINDLNNQINVLKENEANLKLTHQQEIDNLNKTHNEKVNELTTSLNKANEEIASLKLNYENQISELNKAHKLELDGLNENITTLNDKLANINKLHEEELNTLKANHEKEKASLTASINSLNNELKLEKENHNKDVEALNSKYGEELKTLNDKLANINNTHQAELNNLKLSYQNQISQLEKENQALKDRITILEGGTPSASFNAAKIVASDLLAQYQNETIRTKDFSVPTYTIMKDDQNNHVVVDIKWSLMVQDGGVENAITMGSISKDDTIPFTVKYNYVDSIRPTEFTLHCNIMDTNYNKESFELNYVVPAFKYTTFDEFKALVNKPQEARVKGEVTAVFDNGIYIKDSEGYGFLAYSPKVTGNKNKENYLKNYPLGSTVIVTGKATTFSKQYEFAKDCVVELISEADPNYTLSYFDATKDFEVATSASYINTLDKYQNRPVSLTNITMLAPDTNKHVYPFKINNSEVTYYLDNHDILNSLTSTELNNMLDMWTDGYVANINGIVKVFNDKVEILPTSKDSIKITSTELPNDVKVQNALDTISNQFGLAIKDDQIILETVTSDGVRLTYQVVSGTSIKLEGNKLIITRQDVETTNILKVTAEAGDVKVSKDINVIVAPTSPLYISIADALKATPGSEVVVRGTISEAKTDKVVIKDGPDSMIIYKSATKGLEVGQEILVTGTIKEFNKVNQITNGSTCQIISYKGMTLIENVASLKDGTEVSILGKVKAIDTAWNGTNMTITLVDGLKKEVKVTLTTKVILDQEIVVTGKTSSGAINEATSKSLKEWLDGSSVNPGPDVDPQDPTTPTDAIIAKPTADHTGLTNGAINPSWLGLDETWTVVLDDGGNSTKPSIYTKNIRLYKSKDGKTNFIAFTNTNKIGRIKLTITDNSKKGVAMVSVAGQEVFADKEGYYTINATSFEIENKAVATSATQLRIDSITIEMAKQ